MSVMDLPEVPGERNRACAKNPVENANDNCSSPSPLLSLHHTSTELALKRYFLNEQTHFTEAEENL